MFEFVIIGSGNIANTYCQAIKKIANAKIVGIISQNGKRPADADQTVPVLSALDKINFDYDNGADAGTEEALGSEVVCLGECPQGLGCWPTSGEITQLPYSRSHNYTHAKGNLDAFDIAAIISTPVYTPWTGTVCLQAYDDDGYGEYLKLETEIEDQKYYFIFAHLWEGHSIITTPGECVQVNESEVIGQVGDSGNSTGPHLHYELVNSGLVKYELSDLVPDGYNLTGNYDPAGSCFDF